MNPEGDLNMHSSKGLILKLVSEESHPVTILQPGVVSVCTLSVSTLANGNATATSQRLKHKMSNYVCVCVGRGGREINKII